MEIIRCKSIDDNGLRELKILKYVVYIKILKNMLKKNVILLVFWIYFRNLKQLKIKGLPAVTNDIIYKELTEALPNCKIDIE